MSGMQDDHTMPPESDDFRPIWIAFIWPALPFEFFKKNNDALTRAELVADQERQIEGEDSEIVKAIDKAKAKAEAEDDNVDDDNDFLSSLRQLVQKSRVDDEDEEDDDDNVISKARTLADEEAEEDLPEADRGLAASVKNIMRPVEHLVFGRLQARGQRTGAIMGQVLGKIMKATEGKVKVCLMANSLGAHVLCGVLNNPKHLPHKIHTAFFVQSAISKDYFEGRGKYAGILKHIAGPLVCTYSERDLMLKNVFGPFHGKAVGFHGTSSGEHMKMKPLASLSDDPYALACGEWSNVDGTEYVDCFSNCFLCCLFVTGRFLTYSCLLFFCLFADSSMKVTQSLAGMAISKKTKLLACIGLLSQPWLTKLVMSINLLELILLLVLEVKSYGLVNKQALLLETNLMATVVEHRI